MKYPNFNEERKLWRKGYKMVVGIDESGRGPLAGPVIAVAFAVKEFSIFLDRAKRETPRRAAFQFLKIKDSKKITPKKREEIFEILKENPNIGWGIGRVSEKVIDRINILEATKLAMKRAVWNLEKKLKNGSKSSVGQKFYDRSNFGQLDFLIIDGNFGINLDTPQKSIIKADEKVFSCTAAGIIAKVTRDRMMLKYHKKYPKYAFDRHKGYPTKLHRHMIKKYGFCKIHRRSFRVS